MTRKALRHLVPLAAPTTSVAVQDALVAMIEGAGLGVGDRLPPEVAIAATLGVGRSTVREAMNRWEGLGIIRRRRGDGTYLTARVQSSRGPLPTMIRLEGEALLRLLEVRRVLETGTVRRAALQATADQRRSIAALCDSLIRIVDAGQPYREADAAFHGAICDATGNPLFGQILAHLDHAFEKSEESPFSRNAFALRSFPIHRDLSDAIARGDADAAEEAINAIIDTVADEISQIIGAGPAHDTRSSPREKRM
jgi:GntR family transcriptional regulator, transcriptional repressor for pyruvate dehydrogenase complex